MRLITKKRISTIEQYHKAENKIKNGIEGLVFWAILMMVAGNSYLN